MTDENGDSRLEVFMTEPGSEGLLPGRFLWTPGDPEPVDSDVDECVYLPDATEHITPPDEGPSPRAKEPAPIPSLSGPSTEAVSLSGVGAYYTGECDGGDAYNNNCAHYLSNAFIRAGWSSLKTSGLITAHCRSGWKRPIRAFDMLKWFRAKHKRYRSGVIPKGNGVWATYQETPGWKHVVISDTDKWKYYGTGDYPDWPVQKNYQW